MLALGIILLVVGFIGKLFASVSHITDSTAKAMGWTFLNMIVGIGSVILMILGAILTLAGIFLG